MLESLLAMMVFSVIVSVILVAIDRNREIIEHNMSRQEIMNNAQMAISSHQSSLRKNGVSVEIVKNDRGISIYSGGELIDSVVKKED